MQHGNIYAYISILQKYFLPSRPVIHGFFLSFLSSSCLGLRRSDKEAHPSVISIGLAAETLLYFSRLWALSLHFPIPSKTSSFNIRSFEKTTHPFEAKAPWLIHSFISLPFWSFGFRPSGQTSRLLLWLPWPAGFTLGSHHYGNLRYAGRVGPSLKVSGAPCESLATPRRMEAFGWRCV